MENKVLNQNIEQIKHYNSNFANEILMLDLEKSKDEILLAQNENGEFNLVVNSIPLHSTTSAIEEAKKIADKLEIKKNSITIIYGLALGYLADSISEKNENEKIVIFEPNLNLIKFVLSIAKIDALYKKNVFLCSNEDDFKKLISAHINCATELSISFLNSYKNSLDDIKNILYLAQIEQAKHIGIRNTFKNKAANSLVETVKNLKYIFSNPLITQLKDIYKNKTAIILCAGPSLKENIDLIKENQDKFIIFALNPTLRLLNENNIKPDFVVAIESNNISAQFNSTNPEESYLISEAFTNSKVVNLNFKNSFSYITPDNFFNNWVRNCLKFDEILEMAGTVSFVAFQSALIMGFKKIILIGQNLAYKDEKCYSQSCEFDTLKCIFNEEKQNYEIITDNFDKFSMLIAPKFSKERRIEITKDYLEFLNKNLCTVKNQEGNLIPSKTDYAVFINDFKKAAQKIKDVELINSSSGGAQIEGFKNIPLSEVIKTLEPIEKLDLSNIQANFNKAHISNKYSELLKNISILKERVSIWLEINKNLLKKLPENNDFNEEILELIEQHKNTTNEIIKLKDLKNIEFLLQIFIFKFEWNIRNNHIKDVEFLKRSLNYMLEEENTSYIFEAFKTLRDNQTFILE